MQAGLVGHELDLLLEEPPRKRYVPLLHGYPRSEDCRLRKRTRLREDQIEHLLRLGRPVVVVRENRVGHEYRSMSRTHDGEALDLAAQPIALRPPALDFAASCAQRLVRLEHV